MVCPTSLCPHKPVGPNIHSTHNNTTTGRPAHHRDARRHKGEQHDRRERHVRQVRHRHAVVVAEEHVRHAAAVLAEVVPMAREPFFLVVVGGGGVERHIG